MSHIIKLRGDLRRAIRAGDDQARELAEAAIRESAHTLHSAADAIGGVTDTFRSSGSAFNAVVAGLSPKQ